MDAEIDASTRRELREERKKYGLSQKKLAELAGVDHTTISRFERGDSDMSPAVRRQLVLALEAVRRMEKRIEGFRDARERYPNAEEKVSSTAQALGISDELPPQDPEKLREWRERMYPVFKQRVDVDFTEISEGYTVGDRHRLLDAALEVGVRRERELEKERDELKSLLQEAGKRLQGAKEQLLEAREQRLKDLTELREAYQRIAALEKELAEERQRKGDQKA